jgi:hypothetical protein
MKKVYIYLFFVGWLFWGCDSVTDLQPQQNINVAIPQAAVNAVRHAYPEATKVRFSTIEKDKIFQSDFEIKVEKMSAIVNYLGVISEMYKQTGEIDLPEIIKKYIETNYSGATYGDICQQVNKDGQIEGYKVRIKGKDAKEITLIFDATGTLILSIADDRGMKPPGMKPQKIYFIDKSELPQAITDYLVSKHGEYKCIKIAVVVEADTKGYSVVISKDFTTYDYLFDEKGNVLKSSSFGVNAPSDRIEDKPLNINDLSSKIKNYLDKEFKGWQFERGLSFSQNNVIQIYNILITYDKKQYSVQFDGEGNYIKKEEIGNNGMEKAVIQMIQPKDLPSIITNYLASKHTDFKYIQSSIVTTKDKKTYWITILSKNITFDYTFDNQGNFINVKEITMKFPDNKINDKPLDPKDIPSKAKEYLDINFKGWVFQKGFIAYAENKVLGYMIAIKVGNDYYYINFDENARFISARKG